MYTCARACAHQDLPCAQPPPAAWCGGELGHRRLHGGAAVRGVLGSPRSAKAGSVRRKTITFSAEDSQRSFPNWSRWAADKSGVIEIRSV